MTISESPMSNDSYGKIDSLPEELQEALEECHPCLTINQLRSLRDYVQKKIDSMIKSTEDNITIEDFEKIKEKDGDGDGEDGD